MPQEDGTRFSLTDCAFRGCVYNISTRTKIRVDGINGIIGTNIDLEDDLAIDDLTSTTYMSFSWRASGRHFLEFEYFNLARSGAAILTAEIEFGDKVFEVGASVSSYFDTEVTRLSYAYLLKDTKKFVFAASAGLHITGLNTGITDISSSDRCKTGERPGHKATSRSCGCRCLPVQTEAEWQHFAIRNVGPWH